MKSNLNLPIDPISELSRWAEGLSRVSSGPLEMCPDFPRIAERYEAWWNHGFIDRPLFLTSLDTNPARPINKRLELLTRPDEWLATKQQDMAQMKPLGDALPSIRVDFGPVMLGGLLGANVEFQSDTTWTHAFINDDWSNAPDWIISEDAPWWKLFKVLAQRVCEDARGRYLLCTPDIGGSCDLLLNLRGSSALCLDAIENPQPILDALYRIYPSWRKVFCEFYRIATASGTGLVHWLGMWSNRPYMIPACDFNFMIGPDEFGSICLPDIERQAKTAGRAVFHLDGPGAARHFEALAASPYINAIQFSPGAQNDSAMFWLDMFKRIQAMGKSVLVILPANEVEHVCATLAPEGLAMIAFGTNAEKEAAHAAVCRRFGVRA